MVGEVDTEALLLGETLPEGLTVSEPDGLTEPLLLALADEDWLPLAVRETVPEAQAVGEEEPLSLVECVPDTLEHPEEDSEGEPLVEPLMLWDTVPDTEPVVD